MNKGCQLHQSADKFIPLEEHINRAGWKEGEHTMAETKTLVPSLTDFPLSTVKTSYTSVHPTLIKLMAKEWDFALKAKT